MAGFLVFLVVCLHLGYANDWLDDLYETPNLCETDKDCDDGKCCSGQLQVKLKHKLTVNFVDPENDLVYSVINKDCFAGFIPDKLICSSNVTKCSCKPSSYCIPHYESEESLCWPESIFHFNSINFKSKNNTYDVTKHDPDPFSDTSSKMVDESTKKTLSRIPLLKTKAGPREKDLWVQRLKEEYQSLIKYVQTNKDADNDWFRLESNKEGTRWFGKCWHFHGRLKYEFDIEFDIPATYPVTAPEIAIPELDGKTAKMFRGGKICISDHFKPLWARNVPRFGIAHAMALGLGPWLAVEVPDLIHRKVVVYKEKGEAAAIS